MNANPQNTYQPTQSNNIENNPVITVSPVIQVGNPVAENTALNFLAESNKDLIKLLAEKELELKQLKKQC